METFLAVILFVLGLILLIKGGDWFVDGAVGIAHRFNMPEILIGATVVSIGTTLPEVMVSAGGALQGIGSMAYGNAIGSIICNTALIAAITIAVRPSDVDKKSLKTPVIFFFIAAAIYVFATYFLGTFNRLTGIILLLEFVIYIVVAVRQAILESRAANAVSGDNIPAAADAAGTAEASNTSANDADPDASDDAKPSSLLKELILLVVGAALIAVGADLLVDNGTKIATILGVPDTVIALTFVALGTSLPELVTAITSLAKGSGALSLGNVIGANMFNLVLVSGMAITLAPFDVPCDKLIGGINSSLLVDIPVMLFVMLFLTIPALIRGKLSRVQGIVLLAVYAGFCIFQFAL